MSRLGKATNPFDPDCSFDEKKKKKKNSKRRFFQERKIAQTFSNDIILLLLGFTRLLHSTPLTFSPPLPPPRLSLILAFSWSRCFLSGCRATASADLIHKAISDKYLLSTSFLPNHPSYLSLSLFLSLTHTHTNTNTRTHTYTFFSLSPSLN